eukprot:138407-Pelagomonas_calceolata.AAC.2
MRTAAIRRKEQHGYASRRIRQTDRPAKARFGKAAEYTALQRAGQTADPQLRTQFALVFKHMVELAKLVMVMVPGLVEGERMFSAMKYLQNPQRNSLKQQHLTHTQNTHTHLQLASC